MSCSWILRLFSVFCCYQGCMSNARLGFRLFPDASQKWVTGSGWCPWSASHLPGLQVPASTPVWCPCVWHQDMVTTCRSFTYMNCCMQGQVLALWKKCWDWAWAGSPPCLVSQLCPLGTEKRCLVEHAMVLWPDEWPGLNQGLSLVCGVLWKLYCYVYAWFSYLMLFV